MIKIFASASLASILMIMLTALWLGPHHSTAEASHTACIWAYSSGDLDIEYRWANGLGSPSDWKTAFSTCISDWNTTSTPVNFVHDSYAASSFNVYDLDDGWYGFNTAYCYVGTGEREHNDTWGNLYYDTAYSANERRSITGHELGHAVGLYGFDPNMHSTSSSDLMYGPCCPSSTIYTPQSGDISETNSQCN